MRKIFCALALCLLPLSSQALLEFSIGYQGILSSTAGGNWLGPVTMSGGYGLTFEGRFEVPATGLGFGLRYGKLGLSGSSGGSGVTMDSTALSALFAYRFINTGLLFGAVATYGLSNSGSLTNSAATPATATAGSVTAYTAGLEIGLKLPILLALEFGYGKLTMSSFGSQTLLGNATNVDIGGTYARVSTGFNF